MKTFEEDIARLEAIVSELDEGTMPLDVALRLFEEGVERLRAAAAHLAQAEARVKVLRERVDGAFELTDAEE